MAQTRGYETSESVVVLCTCLCFVEVFINLQDEDSMCVRSHTVLAGCLVAGLNE